MVVEDVLFNPPVLHFLAYGPGQLWRNRGTQYLLEAAYGPGLRSLYNSPHCDVNPETNLGHSK